MDSGPAARPRQRPGARTGGRVPGKPARNPRAPLGRARRQSRPPFLLILHRTSTPWPSFWIYERNRDGVAGSNLEWRMLCYPAKSRIGGGVERIIVRRGRYLTFELLRRTFGDDPNIEILWDRRRAPSGAD